MTLEEPLSSFLRKQESSCFGLDPRFRGDDRRVSWVLKWVLGILACLLSACGGNSVDEVFGNPILAAVDSANDRLFVAETDGVLSVFTASTTEQIGDEPIVQNDDDDAVHNLLPVTPMNMAVADINGVSRLFITGVQADEDGNNVTNRILVLDFDGTAIVEADFSPIAVEDGDDTTDDSDNLPGGLAVDTADNRLYATDASAGRLFIFSVTDGTEVVASMAIAGTPNKMSLDLNRLYVANSTATEDDQVVTVVNTDDFTTTEIDLDIPTDAVSVLSNGTGTVMLAKNSGLQKVLIRTVDTTIFAAATAIPVGDDSASDGEINPDGGVTAAIGGIVLTKDSSGTLYGYVPQADGMVELITISSDLSSFTATPLETLTAILEKPEVLADTSGNGSIVYIPASGSGDLLFTDVGSAEVDGLF